MIDSAMCIGCGACVAADATLALELDPNRQTWRPSHASNRLAAEVCPALGVDFDFLHQRLFPGMEVGPHGVVESVLLAQSVNLNRNLAASSGGLIKELLIHYLAQPHVDGLISLVHKKGIEFEPEIITEPTQVDELPGSVYHSLPFDKALRHLADNEGRFVLVAIPCQLEGIFTYIQRQAPHLMERIHSTIGLLCGWQYSHHALRAISQYKGVDFDTLTDVAWRGGGPVGKLRLTTPQGETAVSRRVDFSYQVAFDRTFNSPRCHLCINHSNFLADLVVGDAWLPSTVYTKTGISLIICRTPSARAAIDEMTESGRIKSTVVSTEEITESQTHRVVFGDFAYAYQDYLRENGLPHPTMRGPNRVEADLVDHKQAAEFHHELQIKLRLQDQRRYRRLWWRKLIRESPRLAKRYLDWFLVRILRIKSLTRSRQELGRDKIRIFR